MEYLLWKGWDEKDEKFKRYRITSKNSIEHVSPQNPESGKHPTDGLDLFGNLGLLSVGQNSSYSHQDEKKKKIDFETKDSYDSLKLAKIYSSKDIDNWGIEGIKKHQNEMIKLLEDHYK